MLFNGRALIFMFSRTQVRIAEIERLQSLFKMSIRSTTGGIISTNTILGTQKSNITAHCGLTSVALTLTTLLTYVGRT